MTSKDSSSAIPSLLPLSSLWMCGVVALHLARPASGFGTPVTPVPQKQFMVLLRKASLPLLGLWSSIASCPRTWKRGHGLQPAAKIERNMMILQADLQSARLPKTRQPTQKVAVTPKNNAAQVTHHRSLKGRKSAMQLMMTCEWQDPSSKRVGEKKCPQDETHLPHNCRLRNLSKVKAHHIAIRYIFDQRISMHQSIVLSQWQSSGSNTSHRTKTYHTRGGILTCLIVS